MENYTFKIPIKNLMKKGSISDEERPGTTLRPSMHDTTTLQKEVLASMTIAQLESDTDIEMEQREIRGEFNKRPKGPPDATHSDIKTD